MTITVPELDTVDFEALIEEAKGRIPRYAPAWTDHNLHDPGITLLELLAWVTDQQIYQTGFVGPEHRAAFAKLLGVTPARARPAYGLLWPQTEAPFEVDLPPLAHATATESVDLSFLVDIACRLSTARVARIDGESASGPMSLLATDRRDRASFPAHRANDRCPHCVTLHFDRAILKSGSAGTNFGTVTLGIEIENPGLEPDHDPEGIPSWGPLAIEHRIPGSVWQPLRILRDDTCALLKSGIIALQVPATPDAASSELRLHLDEGFFPSAPRISRLELNALPVIQLEQREEALLKPGTGLPDQTQPLPLRGLTDPSDIAPPIAIEVAGAEGWEHWEVAPSLADLGPDDRRLRLDIESDSLCFGNGVNGKVPPLGAQIRHRDYALTSGRDGNMRAGLTWRLSGQALTWENRAAFGGGEDAWDAERLSLEARRQARHPVIATDDEALKAELLALPGFAIARADILPLHHPALPAAELARHKTVVVVPEIMRERDLSEDDALFFLRELRAHLAERRLAGERLHVTLPPIRKIRVQARLLIEPSGRADTIIADAEASLAAHLAPLPPLVRVEDDGWPFGRDVSAGQLSGILAAHDQVIAVTRLELAADEGVFAPEDITLLAIELPRGGDHIIDVVLSGREASNAAR